jgi:hypothetical protein
MRPIALGGAQGVGDRPGARARADSAEDLLVLDLAAARADDIDDAEVVRGVLAPLVGIFASIAFLDTAGEIAIALGIAGELRLP